MESKSALNRRQFLKNGAWAVAAIGAVGVGANYLKHITTIKDRSLLRPPGAMIEDEFIYACIKCGLCVQICPIEAVKLADINDGLSYGTPYIDPRKQACDFSCDAMQCVETCPTAALNFIPFKEAGEKAIEAYDKTHKPGDPDYNLFIPQSKAMKAHTNMGIAKINLDTCLAAQGKGFKGSPRDEHFKGVYRSPNPKRQERKASPVNQHAFNRELCDLCVTECPIGETAIVMDNSSGKMQPKVLDACTGCGVCVMLCPSNPVSISIEKSITA